MSPAQRSTRCSGVSLSFCLRQGNAKQSRRTGQGDRACGRGGTPLMEGVARPTVKQVLWCVTQFLEWVRGCESIGEGRDKGGAEAEGTGACKRWRKVSPAQQSTRCSGVSLSFRVGAREGKAEGTMGEGWCMRQRLVREVVHMWWKVSPAPSSTRRSGVSLRFCVGVKQGKGKG